MIDNITQWLNDNFNEEIVVNILEDNKYQHGNENIPFNTNTFIIELSKYNFKLDSIGSKEFYITLIDFKTNEELKDLTIQVSNFEFETELDIF